MRANTERWRPGLRPVSSTRGLNRVAIATIALYLAACLPFVLYVEQKGLEGTHGSHEDLAYFAGEYATTLSNQKIRSFHAGFQYFWPFIDKSRVTAELKGLEKCVPRVPTTPITFNLMCTLAWFVKVNYGMPQAVGIIVCFGALLRSAELVKVRVCDVIFREKHIVRTYIRLGSTKNNREQVAVLEPNSMAERALRYLLSWPGVQPFAPCFEIPNYQTLYRYIIEFKQYFRINLHFTPHSLRAGGATNLRLRGFTHHEICDMGRWEHLGTAKSYVDVVFQALPETIQLESRVQPNGEYAVSDILGAEF